MKSLLALVLLAAFPVGAQFVHPDEPKSAEDKAFYSAVAKAIFAQVPGERGKFGLTLDPRQPPTFYGREPNTIEPLPCERIAAFGLLGFATELGHIGASGCSNGAKAAELSLRAKAHFAAMAKQFGKNEAELRAAGWSFTQETVAGGEYYYFPVFIISHGVVGPVSGVLHDRKTGKALVVQVEVRRMCEQFQEFKAAPFCADLPGAVKRLVLDLRGVL